MSIILWIVVGLIAGFIGNLLANKTGKGFVFDIARVLVLDIVYIALALAGAMTGGSVFELALGEAAGSKIYSLIGAGVGAVVFLVAYFSIRRPGALTRRLSPASFAPPSASFHSSRASPSSIALTPSGSARPCDRARVRPRSDYPARLGLDLQTRIRVSDASTS